MKKFGDDFNKLPEDSIKIIISFLERKYLFLLSQVSKMSILSKVSQDNIFWKDSYEKLLKNYSLDKEKYKFTNFKKGIIEIHKSWVQKLRNNYHPNLKEQEFYGSQPFLSVFQETRPKTDQKDIVCGFFGENSIGKSHLVARLENDDYETVKFKDCRRFPIIVASNPFMIHNSKYIFKILPLDTCYNRIHDYKKCCEVVDSSHIIVFCFSVVDQNSFKAIDEWVQFVRKRNSNVPLILVGTMIDKREEEEYKNSKIISFQEGVESAKRNGCVLYYEVSTKIGIGIEELKRLIISVSLFEKNQNRNCLIQ